MNYFLLLHDHPPIIIHEEDRKAYYQGLERFDQDIEISELVGFLTNQLEKTWDKYLDRSFRSSAPLQSLSDILQSYNEKRMMILDNNKNENKPATSKDHDVER